MPLSPERIGITTTIPVEVLFAAGRPPVDLNNCFVTGPNPNRDIAFAEQQGFPRSCCAWLKGLYGTIHRTGIETVIGVTQGDCSETHALLEILESEGKEIIPFAFPFQPNPKVLHGEIVRLADRLEVDLEKAEAIKANLDSVRSLAHAVDACYGRGIDCCGQSLFRALINCSDFEGDPAHHAAYCRTVLEEAERAPLLDRSVLRIGLLGVPPIYTNLIETVEAKGARICYHEVPRQFALPALGQDIAAAYSAYTYPYGVKPRLADIGEAIRQRKLDGLIHYVQSFCHRQMHDRLLRENLGVPLLTLEGDRPGPVDGAVKTRVEAFLEMLA